MITEKIEEHVGEQKARLYWVTWNYSYDASDRGSHTGISEQDWRDMVVQKIYDVYDSGSVDYMAYIFHDRDIDDNGGKVALHCHVFVRLKKSTRREDTRALFNATSYPNCQLQKSGFRMAKYMLHISDDALKKQKVMYDRSEVATINCDYAGKLLNSDFWDKADNKEDKTKMVDKAEAQRIVNGLALQIKNGTLRKKEAKKMLEEQAGYYWVRLHRSSFEGDQQDYIDSTVDHLEEHGRDNTNIYITGAGGVGKSNLGRKLGVRLSNGQGFYRTAPLGLNKTPDALNHYTDEAVALYNEFSPWGWTLDEFLDCFDFYEYAPFPSRNENKHFLGHTSIFANSINPLRFSNDMVVYSKGGSQYQDPGNKRAIDRTNAVAVDKYWQVRRRFKSMIILIRDKDDPCIVHGHVFNLRYGAVCNDGSIDYDDGEHVWVGRISFDNAPKKEPYITGDTLYQLEHLMHVDTSDMFTGSETFVGAFLEENGFIETFRDALMDDFIENVVDRCRWDLLPSNFLYDIYRKFRNDFYPSDDLMTIREFIKRLDVMLDGWDYKKSARTGCKMRADEPLITEYEMDVFKANRKPTRWMDPTYNGDNVQKIRDFPRQKTYSGFVRKDPINYPAPFEKDGVIEGIRESYYEACQRDVRAVMDERAAEQKRKRIEQEKMMERKYPKNPDNPFQY